VAGSLLGLVLALGAAGGADLPGSGVVQALPGARPTATASNLASDIARPAPKAVDPNDPIEREYRQLLEEDDAAQEEVDKWLRDDQKFAEQGLSLKGTTLRPRIRDRFDPVRKHYEDFLTRNPGHTRARIAYGSFLDDMGEEDAGAAQWLKAAELDPREPSAWNNLANHYAHNGEASNAFVCLDKAIELSPRQSVYYQNLATFTYLFRTEARQRYGLNEAQLYERVMALYHKALALDPGNFPLATELAQTYYGFKPPSTNESPQARQALKAHYDAALADWEMALKLARDEIERQGVYVHLARVNIMAGRYDEARRHLLQITNGMYLVARDRLQRRISQAATNAPGKPAP